MVLTFKCTVFPASGMTDTDFEAMIDQVIKLVNTLAPFNDAQKRLVLRSILGQAGDEAIGDVTRGVDVAKMRIELKKMTRNPQKYARKMP